MGIAAGGVRGTKETQSEPLNEPQLEYLGDRAHQLLEDDFPGDEPPSVRVVIFRWQTSFQNGVDRLA